MAIEEKTIRKIARLAHLEITDEEVRIYTPQIQEIVSYVEQLGELETGDVEAATGGFTKEGAVTDTSRPDVEKPTVGQEKALDEAPSAVEGHFQVPKVL